ncbi:penicillin-binding protein 1A [Wenyingzhuangia heitensis]|uniref:Penicillin-binding protein 1A n=1 Tax=Wenyingzhuangia heitensis TaxID=1487859 RepID=A0ABX0U8Q8_9FLAO|nr:transglycosylase domain-containing protein [Wenyingzhuangia heitensis]NIJ44583.1 penicillin-binding protein 1A [Wenyingzhuangia heitensis]
MIRWLFRFLFKLGILGVVLLGLFIGLVYIGGFGPIANKKELTEIKQAQASVVYSSDAKIIGKFFLTNRTNVTYNQLPKHLINALIATEDSRFYQHKGIDKTALLRVIVKTIILGNQSAGGGSTISQQLAKNIFKRKDFSVLSMPVNKTKEAILANRLENIYSKSEILTLYFNTVPFGENVYGIESAAQRYFSVSTDKLSLEQSAILVGMLKANSYYNPNKHPENALRRRNVVLHQMLKADFISEEEYDTSSRKDISTAYTNIINHNPNGYFLYHVKNKATELLNNTLKEDGTAWNVEKDGLIIETTLHAELQTQALKAREEHLKKLQKSMDSYWNILKHKKEIQQLIQSEWHQTKEYKTLKNKGISENDLKLRSKEKRLTAVFDWEEKEHKYSALDSISHYLKMINAAIYGVSPKTGAIQIYVGGNNFEYLPYNLITSEHQSASTFKPIVYAAALEKGNKPCDWINNEEKTYTDYDNWKPQNYDHTNGGYYSMVGALAKSVNIPTVATYFDVGHSKLQETANALGLDKELNPNPSTALGTNSFSLQKMVHAYVPFATRSNNVEPYYISTIKDHQGNIIYQHKATNKKQEPVLSHKTLETMQYLLKGVVDNGTAIRLKTSYTTHGDWAGKTGTSQDYSDSWFIGFNADIVIGAWVGCKYPSIHLPSRIGGGSVAALPIVGKIASHKYIDKKVNRTLAAKFPKFDDDIIKDCDCEFYREENTIEKFFDIFDKNEKTKKKKGNFFTRLFGRKKDKDSIE